LSYWPSCSVHRRSYSLFRLSMRCVLPTPPTVLFHLETVGRLPLVLRRVVVPALTVGAGEDDDVSHVAGLYSTISVMVPEPTVRPPSRIANRSPFSSATGVINSTDTDTLSPGITISTPSGRFATPVTSVVRR